MNLVEVLVASAVFALAGGASAGIWASTARALNLTRTQELQLQRLDASLQRSEALLRAHARQHPDPGTRPCPEAAGDLAALLGPGAELLSDPQAADPVVRLIRSDGPYSRQRLFSPAAYGLCIAPSPSPTP